MKMDYNCTSFPKGCSLPGSHADTISIYQQQRQIQSMYPWSKGALDMSIDDLEMYRDSNHMQSTSMRIPNGRANQPQEEFSAAKRVNLICLFQHAAFKKPIRKCPSNFSL